uniref:Uncharacterized protein n=1 Tax=Arundo donax TaxID=35708 RepID=A0A0A9CN68_ARUDO
MLIACFIANIHTANQSISSLRKYEHFLIDSAIVSSYHLKQHLNPTWLLHSGIHEHLVRECY